MEINKHSKFEIKLKIYNKEHAYNKFYSKIFDCF